jgi:hypothetical protein
LCKTAKTRSLSPELWSWKARADISAAIPIAAKARIERGGAIRAPRASLFNEHSTQCRAFDVEIGFQQPNELPQLISNRPKPLHQHSLERNRGSLNHVATIMQDREEPISSDKMYETKNME